jgi:subtilisin family serine protease
MPASIPIKVDIMKRKGFRLFNPLRLMLLITFVAGVSIFASEAVGQKKIVVFAPGFSNPIVQEALLKRLGAVPLKPLRIVNGFAVSVPEAAQNALELRLGLELTRIADDIVLHGIGKPAPEQPLQELTWGVDRIEADLAWQETNGTAVNVAILDTGTDLDHPDLSANIKGGYNAINSHKSAEDDNGHGTHVAGIIAAANNDIGVIGVSPEVNLFPVKVLDRYNSGSLSDILDGMQWCIDNHMDVVNMSFGSTASDALLQIAVTALNTAGIVQVAAAGNLGTSGGTILYPAKYPETIAVSSFDINDMIAASSSYGAEIDLAAPGVSVYSTAMNGSYVYMSGTSMAAPHVTASAALLLSRYPELTPEETKTTLKNTAEDLGLLPEEQGSGLVRPDQAIHNPASIPLLEAVVTGTLSL